MLLTDQFLKKLIKEQQDSLEKEFMLNIFLDMYNSIVKNVQTQTRRLKSVDRQKSFSELVSDMMTKHGLTPTDLLDYLENNLAGEIDGDMFETLKDALQGQIYQDDSSWRKEDTDPEELDKMYTNITGKPNLKVVK